MNNNMDVLLKAVKRSPRPFGRSSGSTSAKRHEKLADKWGDEKEPVKEGVTFYLKQVGSTLVEELTEEGASYGDNISSVAVQTIVNMAKLNGKKKLPKMALTVSTRGIRVVYMSDNSVKQDATIYRISFCTADKVHDKIFAYVSRNTENETMECHAFLCPKRKIAQAVTLTVAQAFAVAQEEWQDKQAKEEHNKNTKALSIQASVKKASPPIYGKVVPNGISARTPDRTVHTAGLINFDDDYTPPVPPRQHIPTATLEATMNSANIAEPQIQMGFDDNFVEEDEFSCLAQSRSCTSPVISTPAWQSPVQPMVNKSMPVFNPFLGRNLQTSLRAEDLDEGVEDMLHGQSNPFELTRQPSIDDLLCL